MTSLLEAGLAFGSNFMATRHTAKAAKKQARINREFQERMSNTAHQRATADLEAAGLNRILSLGSPASTPSGATAQVPDYAQAVNSALTARQQSSERKLRTAQTSATDASGKKADEEARYLKKKNDAYDAKPNLFKQQMISDASGGSEVRALIGLANEMWESFKPKSTAKDEALPPPQTLDDYYKQNPRNDKYKIHKPAPTGRRRRDLERRRGNRRHRSE